MNNETDIYSEVKSVSCSLKSLVTQLFDQQLIYLDITGNIIPDSKVHGANMGPTWVLSAPNEPHVGPMNLAIRNSFALLAFCAGNPLVVSGFPSHWDSNTESILCHDIMISHDNHDDVIKWQHFPRYWPFVRWIHRSPVNSLHKAQSRGALMFSLISTLNKRLSKQSCNWWFQTPLCSSWLHWKGNTDFAWLKMEQTASNQNQ